MMQELTRNPDRWSGIASNYNASGRKRLTPFSELAVGWADLGPDDRVIDVACGPGTTTLLVAPKVASVQCVDFAAGMIAQLRENTAGLGNVQSMVADGQDLPLEDAQYTAAFSMFGLMFFPDPVAGLRELHRVLRPGGQVLIGSWPPLSDSPMMRPMASALQSVLPPSPEPPQPFAFDTAELLEQGLRDGGFDQVEVRRVAPEFSIPSAESYWDDVKGNLFLDTLRRQSGEDWPALEAEVLVHLRTVLPQPTTLAMPAWIGRGRKAS